MSENENIIVKPIITEKATMFRTDSVYVFKVLGTATKIDIKNAVENLFNVKVLDVNTAKVRGKVRRVGRSFGRVSSWKKAYVKLKSGQKIDLIEGTM
ncbi:MAG: 50S ribosomal protein L23 [Candidatus Margulisiibacteriota bacterium]